MVVYEDDSNRVDGDGYISPFSNEFKPEIALILLYSEVLQGRMERDCEDEFSSILPKIH